MTDQQPEARSDIDRLYAAVMADTDALEDAKMTLEVIKETDPGVYDEMINDTLSLIRKALSSSILGVIENAKEAALVAKEAREKTFTHANRDFELEIQRLHEVNAELVEALKHYVNVVVSVNEPDSWEPKVADGGWIARKAIAKAQGDNND